MIDQLDALSQTLSGKREYLDTFNYLINEIKRIDKVRIIISVRTYDLNYDPELQNYRNHKTIKVSSLKPEEVDSILRKLGITYFSLSVQLKNLLSIPNNLNVFCKIYHASLNINSIGTLHDLYDKLWEQKILRNIILNTNSTKVKSFLFRLAAEMNSQQKIALNAQIFFDEYYNEINYLSSERIIQKEGEQLQFFHQTFYDYIFAKQFIEKGQSVEQFILQNNNGLFIRSSLKMIISFLSDYNHNLYLTTFENILKSKDFKFHIKLLLINLLGFEENPSKEEIEFVKVTILKRKKFNPLFIESVNTREWLNLLIQEGILNDLIAKANSKNDNLNLCYQTLSRFLPRERDLVLTYLNSMPEFATKKTFISRLLYFLTEWDNPIGFKLFKESFIEDNEDSFSYYKILEDVTEYDPLWVIEMLKIQLIKRMSGTIADKRPDNSNRDYHENKILEKLYEKDSVSTFNFSYELVELMINKYKPKGEITKNYNDLKFMLFDYQRAERSHGQEHIFYMMIYTLENFAKENTQEFLKIYEKLKNSYSKTFQRLLIYGLIQNPVELKNEIFEFILEQHRRDGFTLGDNVDYQLRQLIKATYKYLNQSQKNQLNKLILSINPVNERKTFTYKNKIMTPGKFYGQTKIYYLESLPPDEIYKNPDLKKTYLELKRKFANTINEKEPNSLRMYGVDPPLSKNAYQEMSLENWITTFKKYNTEHHSDPFSHIGGMTEHGRRFKDEVKKRPHHFSPLIEQLINEEIPLTYLIEGINGLKEANYDPVATMEIFKKAILKKMPRFETMQLIWATEYFTHHQTIDYEVLDFLCYNATNNEDPKIDEGDPLQHGINTVRGAAVERLVKISFNPDFSDKIFETLLKACDDPSLSVRISMMPHMALLMNLDRAKTFELFLKATKHNEEQIIKYSTWSASYLLNIYFDQLKNYFERAIEHESVLEDLAILLAAAWLKNKEGSFELLQIVLNESNKAKSKMVDVSLNNMIEKNGKLNPKCVELYCMFLGNTDDLIAKEYGDSFIHLKPENFKKFLPVLKKYSKSKTGTVHLQYFFDYLMKCVKKYPKECLQLISNYKKHEKPNIGQGDSSDDRIKVVIGIYNSLREAHVSDKKYFDKALSIFDFMLQDPSYRRDAYRVIQEVEL